MGDFGSLFVSVGMACGASLKPSYVVVVTTILKLTYSRTSISQLEYCRMVAGLQFELEQWELKFKLKGPAPRSSDRNRRRTKVSP